MLTFSLILGILLIFFLFIFLIILYYKQIIRRIFPIQDITDISDISTQQYISINIIIINPNEDIAYGRRYL
jgi:hypothetical protein